MKIKVMSLNIWHGGFLFDQMVEFLKSENADVLLLQEVYNETNKNVDKRFRTIEVLGDLLPYEHIDFAQTFVHGVPEGNFPHGNAIFSKFPISARNISYFVKPSREVYEDKPENWPILPSVLQHVELDANGMAINAFNMHGVWDLDGDNYSPLRQQMRDVILHETANLPNVILAGDTNAKASNQAIRELEPQLKSVFGQELKTTFNMRRKDNPGYATAAVDLMFISPNIKVLDKKCPDVDISDHLPVIVTLEIN
ncbi:MAG: endonuclease/exonuclease/phosphatase family protein [Candidatus Saccharimonadales bacterium]